MKLGKFELSLSNDQHQGKRERQEDYFGVWIDEAGKNRAESVLLVVADGMGGLEGGDAVSVLAVDAFVEYFRSRKPSSDIGFHLRAAAESANTKVFESGEGRESTGTTLVALHLSPDSYQWISIGDSLLFRVRDGKLERLNSDHNLGARLDRDLAAGRISESEAEKKRPQRAYLTSNLGLESIPEIEVSGRNSLHTDDAFILASDGLSDALSPDGIETALAEKSGAEFSPALVQAVSQEDRPHQDNVTVLSANCKKRSTLPINTVVLFSLLGLAALLVLFAAWSLFFPKAENPASTGTETTPASIENVDAERPPVATIAPSMIVPIPDAVELPATALPAAAGDEGTTPLPGLATPDQAPPDASSTAPASDEEE
jgi:PPM family protein phosphatase